MATLRDILKVLQYESLKEQQSLINLLILSAILYKKNAPDQRYLSPIRVKRQEERMRIASLIWKQTGSKYSFDDFNHYTLSNNSVEQLLNTSFPSAILAYEWLRAVTQFYFLREEFDDEGIGPEKESIGINTKQWKSDSHFKAVEGFFFKNMQALGLTYSMPWPKKEKINHVLVLGSLEEFVKERMAFLEEFEGTLYYSTGPRGLFNNEASLANILAEEWFLTAEKTQIIQNVLNNHLEATDPKQWHLPNLSDLKKEILQALNLSCWPKAECSYYYADKELYDHAAFIAKRPFLDCEGGPWPVAADMVSYLLKQIQKNKNILQKVKLIPVIALGKNNRLTTSDDTIEAWYKKFGEKLLSQSEKCLFISCNASHSLPFISKNLANKLSIQNKIQQSQLVKKLKRFIPASPFEEKQETSNETTSLALAGPAPLSPFHLKMALSNLAKSIYTMAETIEFLIDEYHFNQKNHAIDHTPLSMNVAKIIQYHQPFHPLCLAHAAVDLAQTYKDSVHLQPDRHNDHVVKIMGLLSYASNVLNHTSEDAVFIDAFNESSLHTINNFILVSRKQMNQQPQATIPIQQLRELLHLQQESLRSIRKQCSNLLTRVDKDNIENVECLYVTCHHVMRGFYIELIKLAGKLLSIEALDFAFLIMGSNARYTATPYSDLEFAIVVNNGEGSYSQAKELTKLVLILILFFKETLLPSLGIAVKDKRNRTINLVDSIFDSVTMQGISYDGNLSQAGKTPLGKKFDDGTVAFRLIGTPQKLAALASYDGYKKDPYLPQLLRLSEFMYGNERLYRQYLACLTKAGNFNPSYYAYTLFLKDRLKYASMFQTMHTMKSVSHDKFFIKPPTVIMDDLYLILRNSSVPLNTKIKFITKQNILSKGLASFACRTLTAIKYLRFEQHCFFKRHKINIPINDPTIKGTRQLMSHIFLEFDEKIRKNTLYYLKQESQLHYQQSYTYLSTPVQIWFLQGIQLLKRGMISSQTFFHVAEFLMPFPAIRGSMQLMAKKMHEKDTCFGLKKC